MMFLPRLGVLWCMGALLIAALFSSGVQANDVRVTLLQSNQTLTYPQPVRLSQALGDALELGQMHSDQPVYPLGSALINPHKQATLDVKRTSLLRQLATINTPESNSLARQLKQMSFAYHEAVDTDYTRVRVQLRQNPLLNHDYWLSLPSRPDHIRVLQPLMTESVALPVQSGHHLAVYLDAFADVYGLAHPTKRWRTVRQAWVIQADRSVYLAKNFSWRGDRFHLSPGAMVFLELDNLPRAYRNLNADIAHLLAHRLEL